MTRDARVKTVRVGEGGAGRPSGCSGIDERRSPSCLRERHHGRLWFRGAGACTASMIPAPSTAVTASVHRPSDVGLNPPGFPSRAVLTRIPSKVVAAKEAAGMERRRR